jgi:uncharacterized protein YqgV (UPF0045/DUF77 family)
MDTVMEEDMANTMAAVEATHSASAGLVYGRCCLLRIVQADDRDGTGVTPASNVSSSAIENKKVS